MASHKYQIVIHDTLGEISHDLPRVEVCKAMLEAYTPPKRRISAFILERDPSAKFDRLDSVFPIMSVKMGDEVVAELKMHADVAFVLREGFFRLVGEENGSTKKK